MGSSTSRPRVSRIYRVHGGGMGIEEVGGWEEDRMAASTAWTQLQQTPCARPPPLLPLYTPPAQLTLSVKMGVDSGLRYRI